MNTLSSAPNLWFCAEIDPHAKPRRSNGRIRKATQPTHLLMLTGIPLLFKQWLPLTSFADRFGQLLAVAAHMDTETSVPFVMDPNSFVPVLKVWLGDKCYAASCDELEFSMEAAQDLKAVHNIDAEEMLADFYEEEVNLWLRIHGIKLEYADAAR